MDSIPASPQPPPPALARPGQARQTVHWVLALLCAAPFLVAALLPPLNHDVAAVLNFSVRWLEGERLYADLIDVNPPLIFIINLVPAALGAWLPIDPVQALVGCVLGLIGLSMALAWKLMPQLGLPPMLRVVALATLPVTLLGAGYDFAQREHLLVILSLPYLILAALRAEGGRASPRLTLLVALLAALGFALKPHFLALPGLVELWVFCCLGPRRMWRDPVPWIMGGVFSLYLASLPLIFPLYLNQVVPLVLDNYLALAGLTWWQLLTAERVLPLALLLPVLGVLAFAGGPILARPVALAALGAFIAAYVQGRAWSYHLLPTKLLLGWLAALLLAHWASRLVVPPRAERAAAPAAALAAFGILLFQLHGNEAPYRQINWAWSRGGLLTEELRREAYGERLLVLAPDVAAIYPALNYIHAQSTLRTMNLWLLQGVYRICPANGARYREPWDMSRTEFFVYRTVAEDFSRAPPAAILVADNAGITWCGNTHFDLIAYFSRHPLFAEGFSHYRLANAFEGYRLYRREDQ